MLFVSNDIVLFAADCPGPNHACWNAIIGNPNLRKKTGWRNIEPGELKASDFDVMDGGAGIDKGKRMKSDEYPDYDNLQTFATVNGKLEIIKCPSWDWSLIPKECRNIFMVDSNCLPKCGKYEGDEPDIGKEWFEGQTHEQPWGDWDGIPVRLMPSKITDFRRKNGD